MANPAGVALPKTLAIEYVAVEALAAKGAPYNPRKISEHDLAALRRSLTTFGAVEPIVVNRRTGVVVGGHQRIRAAIAEGIPALPVVHVDLDDVAERQLNLALNRISGEWDTDRLGELLEGLKASGADEFHRFTRADVAAGRTAGWRLEVGWFLRASGLEWAWFSRDECE